MGLSSLTAVPPGIARRLAVATLIDWCGTGVWITTSTVLMVRVVHLHATQVGLGLTAGGLLGLAAVWPVTNATRRWPVRRVAMSVQVLRGLFFLSFLAVHSAPAYYLAAALVAIVDRPATSVNQILVSRYVPAGQRTPALAGMHIATNAGITLGALFALINAVMYGTVTVAVRGMTRTESANTLVIWQCLGLAFFHSFLLFFGWRWPSPTDAAMLFGTGFINVVGQWCWTKALHLAPAPAVTPFYYLMLVWAVVIGFFVWGEVPTISLLIGSAIVVATGLFLFLREARLQQALRPRP